MKIEGEVYTREFDCGGSYSQYGDIELERGWNLTDELLHEFEGKKVRVTIEVIEKEPEITSQLKRGDKLRRISDGKAFTFACKAHLSGGGYIHVEEMLVPVKLSDFEKEG